MPEIATGAGDRKRKTIQHAEEVTRKKEKDSVQDMDEEAPVFTKTKIGGAKDIIGKSLHLADAIDTSAAANPDFRTVGGIRAEHGALTDCVRSGNKHPVHLLGTQPGSRETLGITHRIPSVGVD
jgi:hypothetical protein